MKSLRLLAALFVAVPAGALALDRAALAGYSLPVLSAPVDAGLAELGRQLYFDRRLSGDGTMNCATCHLPGEDGFADGREVSAAYPTNGHFRNTPTTVNAALRPLLTWDGRAAGVAAQAVGPITNPFEMNLLGDLLVEKLRGVPAYREAFARHFQGEVTLERVGVAIGEFEKTLLSKPSGFDRWLAGEEGALSDAAKEGMDLFFGKARCVECHEGPHFGATRFESMGLEANPRIQGDPRRTASLRYFAVTFGWDLPFGAEDDWGRQFVTGKPEDKGRFLVPSLRQLARTAPYGHDGRFPTLRAVLDVTLAGGGGAPHVSDKLKPLTLNEGEKQALEAFLLSLTGDDPEVRPPRLPE